MVKTGIVDGVVKTASADNEDDPIGAAAKCISDANAAAARVAKAASRLDDINNPGSPGTSGTSGTSGAAD